LYIKPILRKKIIFSKKDLHKELNLWYNYFKLELGGDLKNIKSTVCEISVDFSGDILQPIHQIIPRL